MNCRDFTSKLDDYIDGTLEAGAQPSMQEHLQDCTVCRRRHEAELKLRAVLRALPVPAPRPGFVEEVLARAAASGAATPIWRRPALGLALAASLVIGIALGLALNLRPEAPVHVVSLAVEQPQTLRLKFTSATALSGATMTLSLPDNVELVGYAGRRELTWQTDLREGANLLQLPLIARGPVRGELVAQLGHGESRKTFRVRIDVTPGGATALPRMELKV